jgi:hypothetical protein
MGIEVVHEQLQERAQKHFSFGHVTNTDIRRQHVETSPYNTSCKHK